MALPAWDSDGRLPAGIHRGSLANIYERCVVDAPNREWRETRFGALTTYISVLRRVVPAATAWVDGGFTTSKPSAPFDVDVVIHPDDWNGLSSLDEKEESALMGALTLQDAIIGSPVFGYLPRIQPVAGALDAFLCFPGQEQEWSDTWSSVKGDDGLIIPGAVKGFVEVAW